MATDFWFKFKFKDWVNDTRPLSVKSKGILMELIIYMRQSTPKGECELDISFISRITGGLTEEVTEALTEFEKFATLDFEKRDEKVFLISRLIKKEFQKTVINQMNGKKGGNPRLTDSDNRKEEKKDKATPNSNFNSNSEFESKEKGGMGEKTTFDPTLVDQKFNEFSEGQTWLESVSMQLRTGSVEKTQELLYTFLLIQNNSDKLVGRIDSEIKSHFNNWAQKQIKDYGTETIASRKTGLNSMVEVANEYLQRYHRPGSQ